jgi:mannosidase alpha-like ER degradation enhancer 2
MSTFHYLKQLSAFWVCRSSSVFVCTVPNIDRVFPFKGGLLSAHLFAIDATLQDRTSDESSTPFEYDGRSLLSLAIDLGQRLLPAFDTKTKIPFGTVNLVLKYYPVYYLCLHYLFFPFFDQMYGVPEGETKIASTAGAGSLLIEFEVLSLLSGDESFGRAALLSMKSIYKRRSSVGLVGKHINTETGAWHESISGNRPF